MTLKSNNSNNIEIKQATQIDLRESGQELIIGSRGTTWKLQSDTSSEQAAEMFTPENINNIALVCIYEKKPN